MRSSGQDTPRFPNVPNLQQEGYNLRRRVGNDRTGNTQQPAQTPTAAVRQPPLGLQQSVRQPTSHEPPPFPPSTPRDSGMPNLRVLSEPPPRYDFPPRYDQGAAAAAHLGSYSASQNLLQPPVLLNAEGIARLVTELMSQLQQPRNNAGSNASSVNLTRIDNNFLELKKKLPTFDNLSVHPVDFLNLLEGGFELQNMPYESFKFLVNGCFIDSAKLWADAYLHTFSNYQTFKASFLDHFWDRNKQRQVKSRIESVKYGESEGSMVDHFNLYVSLAKHLDPPYTQEELIREIANHFPDTVAFYLMGATNFVEALERLRFADGRRSLNNSLLLKPNTASNVPFKSPHRVNFENKYFPKKEKPFRSDYEKEVKRNVSNLELETEEQFSENM